MSGKTKPTLWANRMILDSDHANDLEAAAASREFGRHVPRFEAEQQVHAEYVRDHRLTAAAHHLAGIKAAHGAGDLDVARKHGHLYANHLAALGLDPHGPIPELVKSKMGQVAGVHSFKAHDGDVFAVGLAKSEILEKSTPPSVSDETFQRLVRKHGVDDASKMIWAAHERAKARA